MVFIGICGASGSGKSTLAASLKAALGEERCIILEQDSYYSNHPDLTFEQRCLLNYDKPDVFDHDVLLQDVRDLLNGRPITKKRYDFSKHARDDAENEFIFPKDVLILEGIHSFYDQRLLNLMYLKLYMKVEPDICLLRRIQRDIKERGRDIEEISQRYLNDVKPMFDQYIKNYGKYADVIVAGGGKNARIVDILAGYVQESLNTK